MIKRRHLSRDGKPACNNVKGFAIETIFAKTHRDVDCGACKKTSLYRYKVRRKQ